MALLRERLKAKRQEVNATRGGFKKTVRLPVGKNVIRILPNWKDPSDLEQDISQDFGQFWIKDPKTGKVIMSYVDSEITFNTPSPVGQALDEAIVRAPNDSVREQLKGMKSRRVVLFNALVRNGENPETPVILEMNWNQADEIYGIMEDYGNIHDPEKGIDIVVERTGAGFDTKYSVRPLPESKSKPVPAKVMSELEDLNAYVNQISELKEKKALAALGTAAAALGIGLSSVPVAGTLEAPEETATAASYDMSEDDDDVIQGEISDVTSAPADNDYDDLDALMADLD